MELSALNVFITASALLVMMILITSFERSRGRRMVATGLRNWLDVQVSAGEGRVASTWHHFVRYVLQLGWYYSLHKLLQGALKTLVKAYEYIEGVFERNHHRARILRAEKLEKKSDNHLTKMAEHKAEVGLSPDEQARLRAEKLEERH